MPAAAATLRAARPWRPRLRSTACPGGAPPADAPGRGRPPGAALPAAPGGAAARGGHAAGRLAPSAAPAELLAAARRARSLSAECERLFARLGADKRVVQGPAEAERPFLEYLDMLADAIDPQGDGARGRGQGGRRL